MPVHEVCLAKDYWIGKYPVANEEYRRFLEATNHREPKKWSDRKFNQPRQPVVGVSWEDAQAFCQ